MLSVRLPLSNESPALEARANLGLIASGGSLIKVPAKLLEKHLHVDYNVDYKNYQKVT